MIEMVKDEITEIVAVDQQTGELFVPKQVIAHLTEIQRAKKEFEEYEKDVRSKLKAAMQEYGIEKIDTDSIVVNYVDETERISVDSKLLKKAFPEVYEAVTKVSPVSASVRIKLKNG